MAKINGNRKENVETAKQYQSVRESKYYYRFHN